MAHHTLVTIFSPLYTIHISQTHLYHLCRLTLLFSKYYNYYYNKLANHTKSNKSSAIAEMGDQATTDMGLKEGVLCPFRGALGTRLIQCGLRRGLLP